MNPRSTDIDFDALQASFERRIPTPRREHTDAWRLFDASERPLRDHAIVSIDRYGPTWIVSTDGTRSTVDWTRALDHLGCTSVWLRPLDRNEKTPPSPVAGDAAEEIHVHEAGLRFAVRPASGYNCGLFLDQRDNRRRVRERVRPGARILNLFSYTCSFSVVAAAAGATVTSVDLHRGYLDWGRHNFAINGLDAEQHFWTKGDSFDWLAAFAKKGRRFDGVILDPPTFSRGTTKKVFRVEKDYAELVALAARVVAGGGWLLACANTQRQSARDFRAQIEAGLAAAGAGFARRRGAAMPEDFGTNDYLKTLWFEDRLADPSDPRRGA